MKLNSRKKRFPEKQSNKTKWSSFYDRTLEWIMFRQAKEMNTTFTPKNYKTNLFWVLNHKKGSIWSPRGSKRVLMANGRHLRGIWIWGPKFQEWPRSTGALHNEAFELHEGSGPSKSSGPLRLVLLHFCVVLSSAVSWSFFMAFFFLNSSTP